MRKWTTTVQDPTGQWWYWHESGKWFHLYCDQGFHLPDCACPAGTRATERRLARVTTR